jgi:hypothetical protein
VKPRDPPAYLAVLRAIDDFWGGVAATMSGGRTA